MKDLNTIKTIHRDIKFENKIYGVNGNSGNGVFIKYYEGKEYFIIASNGGGWEHVSVSSSTNKVPNWEVMCMIKDLFFNQDETVVQFHPKKSEYVNNHKYCLHLWRKQGSEHELPPSILVGVK